MDGKITDAIERVLVSEEELKKRVKDLGFKISEDYKGKNLTVLAILSGSFMFVADLMRTFEIPVQISFIYASSYNDSTTSSGKVEIRHEKGFSPEGKDILVVEDIVDTGRTLSAVKKELLNSGAKSVSICSLLDKPSRRITDIKVDYVGFEIPDAFVVGYGLDYAYKYRQFPFIGVLKPECIE